MRILQLSFLLIIALISQDCQSGLIGQSGRGGAGCPNCPGGPRVGLQDPTGSRGRPKGSQGVKG